MNLEEFVKRCRNHDEEAVTELINETKTSGFFVARMITGNDADAEEVLQNAYIKIFNNLDALRDDKKFIPWMKSVVEHEAYNYTNAAYKRHTVLLSEMQSDDSQTIYEWADEKDTFRPEKVMEKKTKSEILFGIMSSLPSEQRMTVYLHYFEHLRISEIAKVMECQESTVKSRLKYARAEIKKLVLAFEKKEGIKLHSILPFPYFLYLIHASQIQNAVTAAEPLGLTAVKIKEAIDACTTTAALPEAITYSAPVLSTAVKAGVVVALGTASVGGVAIVQHQSTMPERHETIVVQEPAETPNAVVVKEQKEKVTEKTETVETEATGSEQPVQETVERPVLPVNPIVPSPSDNEETVPITEQRPADTMHNWEETKEEIEEEPPVEEFHPSQSEQNQADKLSSDGAGQMGMHYDSQDTNTTESGEVTPVETPEIIEVKPVEKPTPPPEIVEVKPVEPIPTPSVVTPTPAPTSTPAPTPSPTPTGPSLDYSGATQEGSLTESENCPVGFYWNGSQCVFN